jgi:histidyl-tRNA synthetase
MFEETELYSRSSGQSSDIVTKQMYTFQDRGGNSITLRPEGTAGVVRAYVEHGIYATNPLFKAFYIGPNFRYERPQAGRLRQHHQVGVEVLGSEDPSLDADVISLAIRYLNKAGIKGTKLLINSIGCPNCRPAYREALREFFKPKLSQMCEDCQRRYEINVLRLLDCKNETCKDLSIGAPVGLDFLDEECRVHFEKVRQYLTELGIEFEIDTKLVRGLDYYTKTVFEIIPASGVMGTLAAGGRYDGLVEELGGPPTPGFGFGSGLERVQMELRQMEIPLEDGIDVQVFVASMGEGARLAALKLASELRDSGIASDMDHLNRSLKAQMKQANRLGARYAVILGEDELAREAAVLRDLQTSEQTEIKLTELVGEIQKRIA